MIKNKLQKGVTLIELLVYAGLLGLFLTVLSSIFVSIFKLQLTTQSTSSIAQDTRFIMARLGYDIENAKSITIPGTFGLSTNSLTLVDQNDDTLTYSVDVDGALTLNGFRLNGLNTSISSITFQRIGTDPAKPTVQVLFTIESNIIEGDTPRSQDIQTTYGLR